MLQSHLHSNIKSVKKNSHLLKMVSGTAKGAIDMFLNLSIGTFSSSALKTKQARSMLHHFKKSSNNLYVFLQRIYMNEYEGNTKKITNIFGKLFFHSYLFKLVVHEETFSNKKQIKIIVISCDKIDHIAKPK